MKYRILTAVSALAIVVAVLFFRNRLPLREQLTIAVIPKTTATDYWESLHAGVMAAADGHHVRILWNAPPSEADFAGQAQMVESAIQQKVSAIILAPSQESVLASSVRHARAEHIPVVIVDSPIAASPDHYLEAIGSDRGEMGRVSADRIGLVLGGQGEVAAIAVSPTVESSEECLAAFRRRLDTAYPNIKLVDVKYGLSNPQRSQALTLDLIEEHPLLRAIFALDSFATRGAYAGLQKSGETNLHLVGVAQELDMIDHLRSGQIDSLNLQDPYEMGRLAIGAIVDRPNANSVGWVRTNIALATRETIDNAKMKELWMHYSSINASGPGR